MQDCCLNCKHLEYREGYVYPYRCLKSRSERLSKQELEKLCFSGKKCRDHEVKYF